MIVILVNARLARALACTAAVLALVVLAVWSGVPEAILAVLRLAKGRLVPVYRVGTDRPVCALTFDGVWGNERSEAILDALDRHDAKATFFFGGLWLDRYPETAREIVARGHEIGNHTHSHAHLNSLTRAAIQSELARCDDRIRSTTGTCPRLFRPPFGEYSDKVVEVAASLGYQTIMWSIDTLDWKGLTAAQMVNRVSARIRPGDIILMHNDGEHTPEAVDLILRMMAERGLRPVRLSELVLARDYYIDRVTGEQRPLPSPSQPGSGSQDQGRART